MFRLITFKKGEEERFVPISIVEPKDIVLANEIKERYITEEEFTLVSDELIDEVTYHTYILNDMVRVTKDLEERFSAEENIFQIITLGMFLRKSLQFLLHEVTEIESASELSTKITIPEEANQLIERNKSIIA